jgi:hypothetical protein
MMIIRTAVFCAVAGAVVAPLSAQVLAPAIPDMSSAVPSTGNWSFSVTPTGGDARFSDAASRVQLTITCNRAARTLTIARMATGAAPYLQLWSSSASRNLPASFNPTTHQLSATLVATDSLLDAMAFSRGRIAIGISGQPMLVAPAWPEIGRVVEECRP